MNNWARNRPFALTVACFLAAGATTATGWYRANAQAGPSSVSYASAATLNPESDLRNIWQNAVGEGFRSTTQSIGLSSGATYGFAAFGSREAHHLALTDVTNGHMLGEVCGEDRWYRGNWELRLELFTGARYMHWSCARLSDPNLGLNGVTGMLEVTRFF